MGLKPSKDSAEETLTAAEVQQRPRLSTADVAKVGVVSHSLYATFAALSYSETLDASMCPEGWSVYRRCSSFRLDVEGYGAVAFVNPTTRQCVIAQRGSTDVLSARAALWMYFKEPTIQVYLAEQFSHQVRLALRNDYTEDGAARWVVSYTGHSLGALLAAYLAVKENVLAVTFDSPGCGNLLMTTLPTLHHRADTAVISYVTWPNVINTLMPRCGYTLLLQGEQADTTKAKSTIGGDAAADAKPNASGAASPPASPPPPASKGQQQLSAALANSPSSSPSFWSRMAPRSINTYAREYVSSSIGFGIPEIQRIIVANEPRFRRMMERTEQAHSIERIRNVLKQGSDESAEAVVLRWPTHLMQFIEFENADQALRSGEEKPPHVRKAYEKMRTQLFNFAPFKRNEMPLRYVDEDSQKLVKWWWKADTKTRKGAPLTPLDHKALNSITIEDGNLRTANMLSALEAKQYLRKVLAYPEIAAAIGTHHNNAAPVMPSKL